MTAVALPMPAGPEPPEGVYAVTELERETSSQPARRPAAAPVFPPPLLPGVAGDYWPDAVPTGPVRECSVPGCRRPSRLYAGGWRCDDHRP